MLLDSYSLKNEVSTLLSPAPTGFTKRVNASFQKIDTFLKTLQVRTAPAEALVQAYLIHIADKSDMNFRKILEIKGIRSKQEQSRLVELFQIHRASDRHAANLQQSNPLIAQLHQNPTLSAVTSATNPPSNNLVGAGGSGSGRFDASTFGSALISAALDGVDRLGTPALGNISSTTAPGARTAPGAVPQSSDRAGTPPPAHGTAGAGDGLEAGSTTGVGSSNLNENLKNIGKFFRRDLGGLGGRFGRGGDDASSSK